METARRFFTSDEHIGHANIIKYCERPFDNVDQMAQALIANHNAIVREEDTVYHLGDLAINSKWNKALTEYIPCLYGRHILIKGNHDRADQYSDDYAAVFDQVLDSTVIDIAGREVRLSHYPVDTTDSRYQSLLLPEGSPVICGHVHNFWAEHQSEKGTWHLNVGVDVREMKPMSEHEVESWLVSKGL